MNAVAIILAHAHILSMAGTSGPSPSTMGAVAIVGDRIAYVGPDLAAAKRAAGSSAKVIDLKGRTLLPGFNDAHAHFGLSITLGSSSGVELPPLGRAAFVDALKRESAARPGSEWLFVATRQLPAGLARARDLDFLDRPVFIISDHGGLVSSLGMVELGLTVEQLPDGFVRGRMLASLLARAVERMPKDTLVARAREFIAMLSRVGVTSVQLIDEVPEIFEEMRERGELSVRTRFVPIGLRLDGFLRPVTKKSTDPDWVRVDGIKYFHDDWARLGRYELREIVAEAKQLSRPVVVHVLSRRALASFLDQLEAHTRDSPATARLFRIDHADEVTPELAARIAKLGIIVCSNPSMIPEWHSARAFPMRTLIDAGVQACIGTDYVGHHDPARPLAPLANVALAVTHGGYGQVERITVDEALRAYTQGSAAAEGLADRKGSIEKGKLADLVVISNDPRSTEPSKIADLEVLLTISSGRIVYRAPSFVDAPIRATPPSTIGPVDKRVAPPTIGPPKAPPR